MPKAPRPLFNSAVVPVTLSYLRLRGVDAAALATAYLPPPGVDPSRVAMTTAAFRKFMADASKRVGDPLLGLHIAMAMPRGAYGLIEFALRSAPTARAALDQLARFGPLINPAARFWVEPMKGCVALHHRLPAEPGGVGPHGNLFTVGRLVVMAREMMGATMTPGRVWLAHPSRTRPAELATFFGTDRIEFGRTTNGLTFDDAALDRPLDGADAALNAVLREHCSRLMSQVAPESAQERTRTVVAALLPEGEPTLGGAAKRLHLSERTLQRRLTEEGVTFADLLTEVRVQLAHTLLVEESLPVVQVAARLGYADAAAFGRAFKRWTGKSPGAFRAK